ncbi:hypothetical protein [Pseudomonas putida]|uniref:hypothetical protein n=1 Tax=Pseudomonas putida TaxID=303 RepID=UPI003905C903
MNLPVVECLATGTVQCKRCLASPFAMPATDGHRYIEGCVVEMLLISTWKEFSIGMEISYKARDKGASCLRINPVRNKNKRGLT